MNEQNRKAGDGCVAWLLACLTAAVLTVTAPSIGLVWDEPAYMAASESHIPWFGRLFADPGQAMTPEAISAAWAANHEHPVLDKIWSGLIWSLARHVVDDLTAYRLGNILLVSGMVALLYRMVSEAHGRLSGLASVAALLTMPRFFFHAHLAALDVPAAAAIFATTYLFWKVRDRRSWLFGLWLGLAWGLSMAIKINALFVPVTLGAWWLMFRRERYLALRLGLMGIIGPLTFVALWPWLYVETWARLREYVAWLTMKHWLIGQWYFGKFYMPPPWHFAFVMLVATVPLTLAALSLVGVARAGAGTQDKSLRGLLVLSALTPLLVLAIGKSMVYDNDRLFMPAFPFVAALAGIGFGRLVQGVREILARRGRPALFVPTSAAMAVMALAPQGRAMVRLYPHYLSYYSETVGGLPGATLLGLETTYWCETYAEAIPYLNERARPGDRVWVELRSHFVLRYYQTHGQLRPDLNILANLPDVTRAPGVGPSTPAEADLYRADWYLFQHHQSQYGPNSDEYLARLSLERRSLAYRLSYDGIPMMELYKK